MTLVLPAYRFVLKDYQAFLALGPGGTPKTFSGYLRVSYLRLFAISDPFRPPSLAGTVFPTNGYLRQLPQRSGPRPTVAGIAPHRQLNQKCTAELHHRLRDGLHQLAAGVPSLIRKGNSCFEKHGLALFLSACTLSAPPDTSHPGFSHLNPTCQDTGEICHLHALDSSMHLTLHPLDVSIVISAGWGERHPLAGKYINGKELLPSGFVMVYAPRDESQIKTVMEIVRAAAWWVGGVDLAKAND
ncbi:hypothetical protein BDR22DRAFT_806941 [Usnea florida]